MLCDDVKGSRCMNVLQTSSDQARDAQPVSWRGPPDPLLAWEGLIALPCLALPR